MKKQKRSRVALKIILYFILVLFIVLTCVISIRPFGIYVNNARFGVYGCLDGGGIVPDGSLVITNKMAPVQDGCKTAVYGNYNSESYPDGMQHIIVGNAVIEGKSIGLKLADGTLLEVSIDKAEIVAWRISYLGKIMFFLYSFRYILWAVWGFVVILIIILEATAPARRHKRYKKHLIKTFDFYGEKFASEDQGKDY